MIFSKACEYGIRATLHVALQSQQGKRVGLKDIAEAIDSPEAFTAKILQLLSKNDILTSTKGPNGGFKIDQMKAKETNLLKVVYAIDGDDLFYKCALGLKQCSSVKPCPLHADFVSVRDNLKRILTDTTIEQLALNIEDGLSFLRK